MIYNPVAVSLRKIMAALPFIHATTVKLMSSLICRAEETIEKGIWFYG